MSITEVLGKAAARPGETVGQERAGSCRRRRVTAALPGRAAVAAVVAAGVANRVQREPMRGSGDGPDDAGRSSEP